MADSRSITMGDRSPVVRRKRGIAVGTSLPAPKPRVLSTPTATPRRSQKRVRFSDPRPETELESASSGLTPFIRRATLSSTLAPATHSTISTTRSNHGDYSIPISGAMQIEPLRQVLSGRVKRRLRRRGLSEEANKIEWEDKREVKLLRTENERLKSELEAKCAEIQSIRDMEDLGNQDESRDLITELGARVQELEQQVAELKAELHQKEVELEGIEDADSVIEDVGGVITNDDIQEAQGRDDVISTPTRLDTSFPSPPPTMPNTPCKHSPSRNTRVLRSTSTPDSSNKVPEKRFQSELEHRREIGLANHTPETAQSSRVRSRKEKVGGETGFAGRGERRQGNRWRWTLAPSPSLNPLGD
ncbi:hypothetical protein L207DRAFT_519773 [Hyaloscypha variabilis F]|uniref:Uncharacterized protein n=1 Tax=Hyaloscypha variabilis (strain UAMH 11265 / GT02V1 / F) TaxID=1149755 RepID=A0A2J6QY15_HYAVF|nr:hypothetical protein L207DRAFT_519773 [Hyaloscypha variabilis F]